MLHRPARPARTTPPRGIDSDKPAQVRHNPSHGSTPARPLEPSRHACRSSHDRVPPSTRPPAPRRDSPRRCATTSGLEPLRPRPPLRPARRLRLEGARRAQHSRQVGRREVQTVAPRSISAWFHAHALPSGRTRSAVAATSRSVGVDGQWKTRPSTRRTLVSTTATCRPCAKQASAFAVYSPTPGSDRSALASVGSAPPCRSTTACAARCRFSARRL